MPAAKRRRPQNAEVPLCHQLPHELSAVEWYQDCQVSVADQLRLCVLPPVYSLLATSSHSRDKGILQLKYLLDNVVKPRDILVFNMGLHFANTKDIQANGHTNATADFTDRVTAFAHLFRNRLRTGQALPHLVFRETTPQHFPSVDGSWDFALKNKVNGRVNGSNKTALSCRNALPSSQASSRLNAIALRVLPKAIPWLRVWNAGTTRSGDHPGMYRISQGMAFGKHIDCSHFCEPSSFLEFMVDSLLAILPSLGLRVLGSS
jgi:hypothetical protein